MVRRGRWLIAGAVLGIAGYRRAERLARTWHPAAALPSRRARPRPGLASYAVAAAHGLRAAVTSYKRSQLAVRGPTLEGQRTRAGAREIPGSNNQKDGR